MDTAHTRYIPYMWEALREGRQALPDCRPNPPVGYVLVRHDRIIARGLQMLEDVGIAVTLGVLAAEAEQELGPYLIRSRSDPLSQGDRYGIRTRNG